LYLLPSAHFITDGVLAYYILAKTGTAWYEKVEEFNAAREMTLFNTV